MGALVERNSAAVRRAEGQLARAQEAQRLELAQGALDVAGIADPSPLSDLAGAGLSLYRGDVAGAGLSLGSAALPYFGDAVAKPIKAARAAPRVAALAKRVNGALDAVRSARASALGDLGARRRAAAELRAQRAQEAARRTREARDCGTCRMPANRFGTRLPTDDKGTWRGEKGNSTWTPDATHYPDAKPVRYREGYPDFGPHVQDRVQIQYTPGDRNADFRAARDAMREKLGDPRWSKPDDLTWHHHQDGVTMELVPYDTHFAAQHTGGFDIAKDPGY
jgi:hypothetical protein